MLTAFIYLRLDISLDRILAAHGSCCRRICLYPTYKPALKQGRAIIRAIMGMLGNEIQASIIVANYVFPHLSAVYWMGKTLTATPLREDHN